MVSSILSLDQKSPKLINVLDLSLPGAECYPWGTCLDFARLHLQIQGTPSCQARPLHADLRTCAAEEPPQQQEEAPAQEPGRTEMSPGAPAELSHGSENCSPQMDTSCAWFSELFTEV